MQVSAMKVEASSVDVRVFHLPDLVTRSSPAHDSRSSASDSLKGRKVMRDGSIGKFAAKMGRSDQLFERV